MATFPTQAKVVIIGAGIVGNSVAYHLANLGWKDIVLIDKGPMPNPGGSTGHASNFIYLTDHNKEMTELTLESARQYREWDVYTECGGLEVARTETRMTELRRRMDSSKNWGIDSARLLTPAEIKELVPFIDDGHPRRRVLRARGRRLRLAPVRDAVPREGRGDGRPHRVRQHRGHRDGRRGRPDPERDHDSRHRRGRVRRHRLRRLGSEDRRDGRLAHPAHAGRPPDDRRGSRPALREVVEGDRVPDRARHGCPHVRAPGRHRARGRLVRPPLDPPRPRGHPVDRGGEALADGVPVHARRTSIPRWRTPSS